VQYYIYEWVSSIKPGMGGYGDGEVRR